MRRLIALTAAAWVLSVVPCTALALCARAVQPHPCCQSSEACCCRQAQDRTSTPDPAAPVAKASSEHPAEGSPAPALAPLPTGAASAFVVAQGHAASSTAPLYLASCAFRC